MKRTLAYLSALALGVAAFFVISALLTGCTTTTTRTVTTDKAGTVTDVTTTTKSADPASMQAITATALAFAPKGHVIREEKSAELQDKDIEAAGALISQGIEPLSSNAAALRKDGKISPEEIAERFKEAGK